MRFPAKISDPGRSNLCKAVNFYKSAYGASGFSPCSSVCAPTLCKHTRLPADELKTAADTCAVLNIVPHPTLRQHGSNFGLSGVTGSSEIEEPLHVHPAISSSSTCIYSCVLTENRRWFRPRIEFEKVAEHAFGGSLAGFDAGNETLIVDHSSTTE